MLDKFLGKVVVIEWEQQTVVRWGRDPICPDSYHDCGLLAKNSIGAYGLLTLANSYEFKSGQIGYSNIFESDVGSIKESVTQVDMYNLPYQTKQFMANFGLSFGSLCATPVCGFGKVSNPCKIETKSCNTCSYSDLLNYKCKKKSIHLQDFKGVCSEWEC